MSDMRSDFDSILSKSREKTPEIGLAPEVKKYVNISVRGNVKTVQCAPIYFSGIHIII